MPASTAVAAMSANSLEKIDAKHSGDRKRILLGDQYRANRLTRPAEKKTAGEAHQRGAIHIPEMLGPSVRENCIQRSARIA